MLHLQISLASETIMRLPEHVLCGRPVKDSEWGMLAFPASQGLLVCWGFRRPGFFHRPLVGFCHSSVGSVGPGGLSRLLTPLQVLTLEQDRGQSLRRHPST